MAFGFAAGAVFAATFGALAFFTAAFGLALLLVEGLADFVDLLVAVALRVEVDPAFAMGFPRGAGKGTCGTFDFASAVFVAVAFTKFANCSDSIAFVSACLN